MKANHDIKIPFLVKHRKLKIAAIALVAFVLVAATALHGLVEGRLAMERLGLGSVKAPSDLRAIDGSTGRTGRFTAELEFSSMAAPSDQRVATEVTWDDDWFFADPTDYNHELATTCSVLSTIANAESNYYQAHTGAPAYMENALAELGFESVSTASYSYRSEIVDEVVNFLTNTNDVTAYSVGVKRLTNNETGQTRTLMLVSIRGSYGSEWISDANMGDTLTDEEGNHLGFDTAAEEIIADLAAGIEKYAEEGGDTSDISLLVTGHSRGGAAANIVAAYADEAAEAQFPLIPASNIYCYAFAVPRTTVASTARDARYDNIFNILNPSDMVPRLPLEAWGYERYGRDVWLPAYGSAGFEAYYAEVERRFEGNVGVDCPADPQDATTVDALEKNLAEEVPTQEALSSAGGLLSVVKQLTVKMDVMRVLYSHYTNVYIACMQSVSAEHMQGQLA